MATIAENLQTIKDSTEAIKQAIIDKGGTISGGLTTYADAIKNISGGGESGSTSGAVSKSDVNFYDYDGTLLHSYTKSAFLELSVFPNLPTRERLTCQGWNYNLSKAQEYVGEYGILDIGATYITDDGKTRLYISIAADGRMDLPLYFSQTVSDGVTIDWGDGSATQTISGTGNKNTTHKYTEIGDYIITLNPISGCTLGLGHDSLSYCIMGVTDYNNRVYRNRLQKVEIGNRVTSIGNYALSGCNSLSSTVIPNSVTSIGSNVFYDCYSLSSIVIPNRVTSIGNYAFHRCYSLSSTVIPNSVTSIGTNAFYNCYSLSSIVIPNSVTSIGTNALSDCYSLSSIVIPNSVTSIGNYALSGCNSLSSIVIPNSVTSIGSNVFYNCYGVAFYDFSQCSSVPTLANTNAFTGIPSDCKIIVPDSLYDNWIVATNWSTYASYIIKKTDYDNGGVIVPPGGDQGGDQGGSSGGAD